MCALDESECRRDAPPAFANRTVFARSEAEVVCASLDAGP